MAKKIKKSFHILFFSHSADLSGACRSLVDLISELNTKQIECSVILPEDGPLKKVLEKQHVNTYTFPYAWWAHNDSLNSAQLFNAKLKIYLSYLLLIDQILPLIKKIKPDFIWTQTITIPWGAICAQEMHIPHILSAREYGVLDHHLCFIFGFEQSMSALFADSQYVFGVSQDVLNVVFAQQSKKPSFSHHASPLYSSVQLSSLSSASSNNHVQNNNKDITIIIPGNICPGKGQIDAVKAMSLLKSSKHHFRLLLFGNLDPIYYQQLLKIIKKEKLENQIAFNNFVNNIYHYINEADIVLSCSRREAFSRTLLEAALLKKPFIYSNAGGATEIFTDQVDGLAYPVGNAEVLAKQILNTIEDNDQTQQRINHAFTLVKNNFNAGQYALKVIPVLQQLSSMSQLTKNSQTSNCASLIQNLHSKELLIEAHDIVSNLDQKLQLSTDEINSLKNSKAFKLFNVFKKIKELL